MTRRNWLGLGLAAPALMANAAPEQPCAAAAHRTKAAAVVTVYRYNSHADVLVGRLLSGYSVNAKWAPSHTDVVSLHAEQVTSVDMQPRPGRAERLSNLSVHSGHVDLGRQVARRRWRCVYRRAWGLSDQRRSPDLYPRFELFSQIMDVYEQSGRSVPTFFDKHLSYSWDKADAIYRRAKKIGFPFMAGSSIPLTIRRPALDPPLETPITEAVTIGYGPRTPTGFIRSKACNAWSSAGRAVRPG